MSSPTSPQPYRAVIQRRGSPTGPVRLPPLDWETFIAEFNQRYLASGLQIIVSSPEPMAAAAPDSGQPDGGQQDSGQPDSEEQAAAATPGPFADRGRGSLDP